MGLVNLNLNNVNLEDNDFGNGDPDIFLHFRVLVHCSRYKACKKEISKELMPVAWHPIKCLDQWMSKDEKKERNGIIFDL